VKGARVIREERGRVGNEEKSEIFLRVIMEYFKKKKKLWTKSGVERS
jgi:hypothetical protein